ncbi:PH domain-containing protein [Paenibacillus sp. 32O-W]|uniref:PH domain-containing protein n=1 Tax=Paenibacillus sp. 32O-W TaxID=1695218 RepID=UPI0011A43415|nr:MULTISPECIES: PH domain-containing protein [Paenibacillaceae]
MEQKLHPNVIRYWQIKYGLHTFKWMLLGSFPLIIRGVWLPAWVWLSIISYLAILFFFIKGLVFICYGVYRKYSRRSYLLGDDELMIRWGNVWSDNSSIIPLSRVLHVDQEQDMLAKRLGLSELTITTAGDHHFIVGLTEEDAVRLRRQIIELSKLDNKDTYYD